MNYKHLGSVMFNYKSFAPSDFYTVGHLRLDLQAHILGLSLVTEPIRTVTGSMMVSCTTEILKYV